MDITCVAYLMHPDTLYDCTFHEDGSLSAVRQRDGYVLLNRIADFKPIKDGRFYACGVPFKVVKMGSAVVQPEEDIWI